MPFMKKLLISISLFFILNNLVSNTLIDKVKETYLNVKTLEADLAQTNFFMIQDINLNSTGKIFVNNNNVVIEYTQPYYQFIKATDEFLTIYSRNENTAFISEHNNQVLTTVLHFHSLVSQDLKFIESTGSISKFQVLKPMEPLQELFLYIDNKTYLLNKISYKDDMGNDVLLEFSNQKINRRLSRTIESFMIPANTNIIYQ